MRRAKLFVFFIVSFVLGALLFRFSIDSVFVYKQPIQKWVNTLKNWRPSSLDVFQEAEESPIQLTLLYTDSIKQVLNTFVENSFDNGYLTAFEKKKMPGKLVFNQDTLEVKFRLKGDYNDHRENNRWSYRIYLDKHQELLGLRTFSLQSPKTKGGLFEWLFYKALSQEGFIALQYHFVSFNDNNNREGLYALEESFDDALLVKANKNPGVILKLDEQILINQLLLGNKNELNYTRSDLFFIAKIECFKPNRVRKDEHLAIQFSRGKQLLEGFRSGQLSLEEVFDVELTAQLFALADIMGAQHGLMWKNVRFYFNETLDKLELISYDAGAGWTFDDVMYNRWKNDKFYGLYADKWFGLFFSDSKFVKYYWHYLRKYTNENWLSTFEEKNHLEIVTNKQMLIGDDSYRENYLDYFNKNARMIRDKIAQRDKLNKTVKDYLFSATKQIGTDSITLLNNSFSDAYYYNSSTKDSTLLIARKPNKIGTCVRVFNKSNVYDTISIHVQNQILKLQLKN